MIRAPKSVTLSASRVLGLWRLKKNQNLITAVVLAVACTTLMFVAPLLGQQVGSDEVRIRSWVYNAPASAVRIEANNVEVGVIVRDSEGQAVGGLKRQDFAIFDDGKQQPLSQFAIETRTLRNPTQAAVAPAAAETNPQAQVPPRTRYIALFFDDLNTLFGDIRHVQLAAENFIGTGVSSGDKIALFTSSGSQTVDFTPNPPEIRDAIEKLKFRGRSLASPGCPRITPHDAYEIATEPLPPIIPGASDVYSAGAGAGPPTYQLLLQEAVQCNCIDETNLEATCVTQQQQMIQTQAKQMWESIRAMSKDTLNTVQGVVDYLAKRPGDRVLVLASSGFLTGTMETDVDALVDRSLRAGVVINALDAKGLYNEDPNHGAMQNVSPANSAASTMRAVHDAESLGPDQASVTSAMLDFALGTGGRFFHNRNDLDAGYYMLAAAPQTEYLLGFSPEREQFNDKFHKLKVEVTAPGKFDVQARPGYFAMRPHAEVASQNPAELSSQDAIDQAVSGNDEIASLPASSTFRLQRSPAGAQELVAEFHVDLKRLPVMKEQDRFAEQLGFVAALYDGKGNFVAGKEAEMTLALKQDTYDRLSRTGINATMALPVSGGTYRLRTVTREGAKGEIAAHDTEVKVQ
jgi:VWFA-related protein